MSETISVDQAARIMRSALREAIRRYSIWYLAQGLLMVIAGIVALVFPVVSSLAVVVMLGWLLIVSGVLQAAGLLGARHVPHFWLQLISAALSLVVGLLCLYSPGEGLLALTLLLIVFFIVGGMARIVFALTVRPLPNWGWLLGSGVLGLLLGVLLFAQIPVTAAWLLGVLVGIQLLSEGAALSWMAWQIRQAG